MKQIMRDVIFLALLSSIVCVTAGEASQGRTAQSLRMNVEFCQFSLPESLKESNANFTVVYSFMAGVDGSPAQINRLRGKEIDELKDEQVVECLSKWRFEGVARNTPMNVSFKWEHGIGWTEAVIAWKEFSQTIKLSGKRCQYSGK
jgi:hypothetical protein